jgi:hypothetical protein
MTFSSSEFIADGHSVPEQPNQQSEPETPAPKQSNSLPMLSLTEKMASSSAAGDEEQRLSHKVVVSLTVGLESQNVPLESRPST